MTHYIHQLAFYIHIITGSVALIIFWLPMIAKKGSAKHKQYGRYFVKAMLAISISGFVMTTLVLIDPIAVRQPADTLNQAQLAKFALNNRLFAGFLFMLSLLVFNTTRYAIAVLDAKEQRQLLRRSKFVIPFVLQLICGAIMFMVGSHYEQVLFQVFAVLCVVNSIGSLKYIFTSEVPKRSWLIEHLGAIFGSGIAAYTAFFVFGGSRLFEVFISQQGQLVLWVLPGVLGTIASIIYKKRYRQPA